MGGEEYELRQFLASNKETPFGSNVRFLILDFNGLEIIEFKHLTTYGVITKSSTSTNHH